MKVRNGFVSNSSSSSFVIALKEGPNELSPGKIMELFEVGPSMGQILYHDLVAGCFSTGSVEAHRCPTCGHDLESEDYDWDREERTDTCRFIADNPGMHYYKVEYSDNEGDFRSELEHGSHWNRVQCLRFSHH
jgi:hypothetical protein